MLRRAAQSFASRLQLQATGGCELRQGICSTSYASAPHALEIPVYNIDHEQVIHILLHV